PPVLRLVCGLCEAHPATPSATAVLSASAARTDLIVCSLSLLALGRRRSASARARAPPAGAPVRGRPAASGRTASAPAVRAGGASADLLLTVFPFAYLAFGFITGAAVALLDLAHQLIALARHLVELVVAEFAPALFQRACHLLPVAGNAVPVHACPSGRRNSHSAVQNTCRRC